MIPGCGIGKGNRMKKGILYVLAMFLWLLPAMPAAASGLPCNNPVDAVFTCIDGGEISTQCSGKPKVLVFYDAGCSKCQRTLQGFSASGWIQDGTVEVCAIDLHATDATAVEQFRDNNCPEGTIRFGLDLSGNVFLAVYDYKQAGGYTGGTTGTPLIAMLDGSNQLRFVTMGQVISSADMEGTYLPALCSGGGGSSNDTGNQIPGTDGNFAGSSGGVSGIKPEQLPSIEKQESIEADNGAEICEHVEEAMPICEATASGDSVVVYQCANCGIFLRQETIPNSAFAVFLQDSADTIRNATQKEIIIDTGLWNCFNKTVFEAIKSRPDVTVTVHYIYEGTAYTLTIPAGTDVAPLMDENGFGGFRYIEKVLSEM